MRVLNVCRTLENGTIEPTHAVEICCQACGYDLDAAELANDTCSDCGQPLNLQQSVHIQVTTMPAASGGVM